MSINGFPQKPPDRAFALQRYFVLHSQHDALQRHLESISVPPPTATTGGARSSPLSASPVSPFSLQHRRSSTMPGSPASLASIPELPTSHSDLLELAKRRLSYPVNVESEARNEAIAEDKMKLLDINHQIKLTLTELLNCENVRNDRRHRMWVQSRLMEAERELKGNRRRDRRRALEVQMSKFRSNGFGGGGPSMVARGS